MKTRVRLLSALISLVVLASLVFATSALAVVDDDNSVEDDLPSITEVKDAFFDVSEDDWYYDSVVFVTERGYMTAENGAFHPDEAVLRGMAAEIIYRLGGTRAKGYNPFSDVAEDAYYKDAVSWAFETGLIYGYDYDKFGPNDNLTREQIAMIIYRYAQSFGEGYVWGDEYTLDYNDADEIYTGAKAAVVWLTEKGIMLGDDKGNFNPKSNVTRAQLAAIVKRFEETYTKARFFFDFEGGDDGFVPVFADYHDDSNNYETYQMEHKHKMAPVEGEESNALFISSMNRSDDIFMGYWKKLEGLTPDTEYKFCISFRIGTNAIAGSFGIGGSPAGSVFVKAGVASVEPKVEEVEKGVFRFTNIDKGEQGLGGRDAVTIGDMGRADGKEDDSYSWKYFSLTFTATTDENGCAYLIIGTESGFEGLTQYYIDNVNVICR
ncbi:MAG TPA: S-layer homology domain-containing protein [Bacillota bacterium]|nr:S-layer homology domain-containing protein [Bacillota bacterium]